MWYEEIADATASHLSTHIQQYLLDVEAKHSDGLGLIQPRTIETANLVGGVYSAELDSLPAYAVDVMNREVVPSMDDAWLYQYSGHIAMIIIAPSEAAANRICKRHLHAVELFVNEHQFMHELVINDECSIHEFGFAGSALSGAAPVTVNEKEAWVAGARVDVVWVTRETGLSQHA